MFVKRQALGNVLHSNCDLISSFFDMKFGLLARDTCITDRRYNSRSSIDVALFDFCGVNADKPCLNYFMTFKSVFAYEKRSEDMTKFGT